MRHLYTSLFFKTTARFIPLWVLCCLLGPMLSCTAQLPWQSGPLLSPNTVVGWVAKDGATLLSDNPDAVKQLHRFTAAQLRVIRNAFFARHGYVFSSPELQGFFRPFDWYQPAAQISALSDREKANVALIVSIEEQKRAAIPPFPDVFPVHQLPVRIDNHWLREIDRGEQLSGDNALAPTIPAQYVRAYIPHAGPYPFEAYEGITYRAVANFGGSGSVSVLLYEEEYLGVGGGSYSLITFSPDSGIIDHAHVASLRGDGFEISYEVETTIDALFDVEMMIKTYEWPSESADKPAKIETERDAFVINAQGKFVRR